MQEKCLHVYAMFFKCKNMFKFTQQATYLNWNPGEPNGFDYENCVHLWDTLHTWNDVHCTANLSYICQRVQGYKFYFILLKYPKAIRYMNKKINFNDIYEQGQCN